MVDTVREGTDLTANLAVDGSLSNAIDAQPISGDGVTLDNQGGFIDNDSYQITLQHGAVEGSGTSFTFEGGATVANRDWFRTGANISRSDRA